MIKEKTIETTSSTKTHEKWYCDICGVDMDDAFASREDEIMLYQLMGCQYPECDCRNGNQIDLCPRCMIEKVMPCVEKEFNIVARDTNKPISW
jgi:hypothetical protein